MYDGSIQRFQLSADQPLFSLYYDWSRRSRGATASLTLTSGSLVCYASDQHHTPEPGNADWTFTIIHEYTEVFFYPVYGRPIGLVLIIVCFGQQPQNAFFIQIDSNILQTTGNYFESWSRFDLYFLQ